MPNNTRALNSFVLNNSVKVSENTTIADPTLVGPAPTTVQLGDQYSLNATTSPPVAFCWHGSVTLAAGSSSSSSSGISSSSGSSSGSGVPSGSAVLDLTNLPDQVASVPNGNAVPRTVNANGYRLTTMTIVGAVDAIQGQSTPPANQQPVTIAPGTGSGYTGWALGLIVGVDDVQSLLLNDAPVIGSSNKNLMLTGAAGDSVMICLGFG